MFTNRAELSSFVASLVDGVADGMPGDRLPGTPAQLAALRFDHAVPLSGEWDLDLGQSLAVASGIYTVVGLRNGGEVLPGYAIHDVTATLRSRDNWAFRVFIDIVFDNIAETEVCTDRSIIRSVGAHPLRS